VENLIRSAAKSLSSTAKTASIGAKCDHKPGTSFRKDGFTAVDAGKTSRPPLDDQAGEP